MPYKKLVLQRHLGVHQTRWEVGILAKLVELELATKKKIGNKFSLQKTRLEKKKSLGGRVGEGGRNKKKKNLQI